MSDVTKKYVSALFVIMLVVVLDQWTKWLVLKNFHLYESKEIWKSFFHLVYVRNYGIAWSIFSDFNSAWRLPMLLGLAYMTLAIVLIYFIKLSVAERWMQWALAFVTGGAIGNLIDRHRFGYVVDFLDFHWYEHYHWPAFNIADSAISTGAVMIILSLWFSKPPIDTKGA